MARGLGRRPRLAQRLFLDPQAVPQAVAELPRTGL